MENQIKKAKKEKKSKKSKGLKWIIIAVCVVAVAAFGLTFARKSVKGPVAEKVIYTVKSETYENVIEISGNISAAQSQELQAAGSGTAGTDPKRVCRLVPRIQQQCPNQLSFSDGTGFGLHRPESDRRNPPGRSCP